MSWYLRLGRVLLSVKFPGCDLLINSHFLARKKERKRYNLQGLAIILALETIMFPGNSQLICASSSILPLSNTLCHGQYKLIV